MSGNVQKLQVEQPRTAEIPKRFHDSSWVGREMAVESVNNDLDDLNSIVEGPNVGRFGKALNDFGGTLLNERIDNGCQTQLPDPLNTRELTRERKEDIPVRNIGESGAK